MTRKTEDTHYRRSEFPLYDIQIVGHDYSKSHNDNRAGA